MNAPRDRDIEERLQALLASLGPRMPRADREATWLRIGRGEYVLALEQMVEGLIDRGASIDAGERAELLDLAGILGSEQAAAEIDLCTATDPGIFGTLVGLWGVATRVGRVIFVILMSLTFLGAVALGVATTTDAIHGQPVLWGTFTEERCEQNLHGCRSFGRWVSDDGRVVKEGIYLDGSPADDGTARAAYKPEGLFNDNDNNIVHVEWASGLGLWLPWALCAVILGVTVYYVRKWRRDEVPVGRWNR